MREIAEHYRKTLSDTVVVKGAASPIEVRAAQMAVTFGDGTVDGAKAWLAKKVDGAAHLTPALTPELVASVRSKFNDGTFSLGGNLYRVEVPEDSDLLDWDKPLSEQPEKVRAVLRGMIEKHYGGFPESMNEWTGVGLYRWLSSNGRGEKRASQALMKAGIPGLRYLDGNSRSKGDGSHNYVIWDENAIGDPEALFQSNDDGFSEEGRRQFREVERAYGGREAYEQAKADGKTKLTYGQWVQVRTPAFLEWFGDWMNDPANASKVVDPETGEPLVVYHGTKGDFDVFGEYRDWETDRKSTRLNSSHSGESRMPSSA